MTDVWQPIKTAPLDWSEDYIEVGHWDAEYGFWRYVTKATYVTIYSTQPPTCGWETDGPEVKTTRRGLVTETCCGIIAGQYLPTHWRRLKPPGDTPAATAAGTDPTFVPRDGSSSLFDRMQAYGVEI